MNEPNPYQSPEAQKPSLKERFHRLIGARVNSLQVTVFESEKIAHEENAAESFETLLADAKGVNRQAAQAIKDVIEMPGSNRGLMEHRASGPEGKVAEWSTAIAFSPQREKSPYTELQAATRPRLSFRGNEVLVDQLQLSVQRTVSKLGKDGEPSTELSINGSTPSEASPNATKWMIRVAGDGTIESALANIKSQSPNGLSSVDPNEVDGLDDMMAQVHFAIWETRNKHEQ